MITINIDELKAVLLPLADDTRKRLADPYLSKAAVGHFAAMQKVLAMLLIFISEAEKKGVLDMKELKDSLSVEIVDLGDIPARHRHSEWFDRIQKEVETLPTGKAKKIDPKVIAYAHLQSIVARMKKRKLLGENIRVVKSGEFAYIAKESK